MSERDEDDYSILISEVERLRRVEAERDVLASEIAVLRAKEFSAHEFTTILRALKFFVNAPRAPRYADWIESARRLLDRVTTREQCASVTRETR